MDIRQREKEGTAARGGPAKEIRRVEGQVDSSPADLPSSENQALSKLSVQATISSWTRFVMGVGGVVLLAFHPSFLELVF